MHIVLPFLTACSGRPEERARGANDPRAGLGEGSSEAFPPGCLLPLSQSVKLFQEAVSAVEGEGVIWPLWSTSGRSVVGVARQTLKGHPMVTLRSSHKAACQSRQACSKGPPAASWAGGGTCWGARPWKRAPRHPSGSPLITCVVWELQS